MSEEKSADNGMKIKAGLALLLVLSVAGNAFLGSMFWQTRQELKAAQATSDVASEEEVQAVIAEVSKLIALPEDITPVLATVNDAESLKERQPFFQAAENGDKVLLYTNSSDPLQRKAYLYRPSTKQLLNVAPINIGGNTIQQQQDEFSMVIRNGTQTAGLEDRMETLLTQVFPNATVPDKGAAVRENYEKSVMVRVEASEELANKVSELFNVEIVDLPAGEARTEGVDLILILGGASENQGAENGADEPEQSSEEPAESPAAESGDAETEDGAEGG